MKIDRSNYEICLIDWLDGNLNDLQIEQLELFLSNNPDLKTESEELASFNLKPAGKSFKGKSHLKKTISDLTESQFEYLCVAFLENDLSLNQEAELKEIIDQNPEKKKTFESIQKTKLTPKDISYKHKNKLSRRTISENIIRLSIIGLSAAAAVALIIMTYQQVPQNLQNPGKDALLSVSSPGKDEMHSVSTISTVSTPHTNVRKLAQKQNIPINLPAVTPDKNIDSTQRNIINGDLIINKVQVFSDIDFNGTHLHNSLVALNNISPYYPAEEEKRSNVGRFVAKNFREIFLKEKTPKDSPLKGYEIAEAGVSGLNKLLGWEMALDKNSDENGELRSVYFSSKILKFNAPVKKTDPLQ
jgi:hypothetical protein